MALGISTVVQGAAEAAEIPIAKTTEIHVVIMINLELIISHHLESVLRSGLDESMADEVVVRFASGIDGRKTSHRTQSSESAPAHTTAFQ